MSIIELKERQDISANAKLSSKYAHLGELLQELRNRELPARIIESVNQEIEELNAASPTDKLTKSLRQKQAKIIELVKKELKIVPKNYYRNLWLALGMSAFGLPIGVAIGLSIGNMGLMAIGLPIGMGIGVAAGTGMDRKAAQEGRQLDFEIKY